MIRVNVKKNNNIIISLNISGHAKYDEYGKDIVCAGVSSALITTVNGILSIDSNAIKYNESNDFKLENIKQDEITNKLLDNLLNVIKSIEEKYKTNIKIKEEN